MELGFDFDDSDFVEKVREKQTLTSYNAKVSFPEWFLNEKADNGKNDSATLYKFRGDYHYYHKNITAAIDCFKYSLECLGSHNRTMRRELVDSLARCYIIMKDYKVAEQFVDQVFIDSLTVDQWCQAMLLKHQLKSASADYKDEIQVLHQLITVFSGNSEFWIKLSDVYRKLFNSRHSICSNTTSLSDRTYTSEKSVTETCDNTVLRNTETFGQPQPVCNGQKSTDIKDITNNCSEHFNNLHIKDSDSDPDCLSETQYEDITSGFPLDLIHLTCLVKARLIFCGVQGTIEIFVKERNLKCVEKLSQQIKKLSYRESDIEIATQYLQRDMHEEDSDDVEDKQLQGKDAKEMMERRVTFAEFNQKWFSWIKTDEIV